MKPQIDVPFGEELDKHVGSKLSLLREKHSLSQTEMGKILGVSYQQVQKYESGRSRLGANKILLVKHKMGVPAEYFFDGFGQTQKAKRMELNKPSAVSEDELLEIISSFLRIGSKEKRAKLLDIAREYANYGAAAQVKS